VSGPGAGDARRRLLPVAGLVAFLALWQAIVLGTRPDPVRPVTLALATPRGDSTAAVVLGTRAEVLGEESLRLAPGELATSAARLRLWFGSLQPTVAGLPPGAEAGSSLQTLLDRAQRDWGGGLDVQAVPLEPAPDARHEAERRARKLQASRSRRPTWLPGPAEALAALLQLAASGDLVRHVVASLFRVATGFALAAIVGVPLGLALGSLAWLSSLLNAVLQCLRPISPIAWLPVATLVLGGGDVAAVFLIFLASFFPIAVSTAAAVATVDLRYRRSAHNFGVRGVALVRRVVFPAVLPAVLTALRVAIGISWVVVVAAEMLGVESGLGFLVLDARNQLRYDRVVAAMIAIGFIGLGLDVSMRRIECDELERRGLAEMRR
jgi:NitT/TauT family transport system permease protein